MDGRGICDSKGYCIRLDGTVAKADITSLVKYSANKVLDFITNYWYVASTVTWYTSTTNIATTATATNTAATSTHPTLLSVGSE